MSKARSLKHVRMGKSENRLIAPKFFHWFIDHHLGNFNGIIKYTWPSNHQQTRWFVYFSCFPLPFEDPKRDVPRWVKLTMSACRLASPEMVNWFFAIKTWFFSWDIPNGHWNYWHHQGYGIEKKHMFSINLYTLRCHQTWRAAGKVPELNGGFNGKIIELNGDVPSCLTARA